ncbi:MAG: ThuA domain-containing protein [Armatimonadota bacterium]|nr:ThuA domain-containing protein [Armatimonadota bacterium]MDW8142247.1 ThuA domain-containing protein [Armatimonadota bacterium]
MRSITLLLAAGFLASQILMATNEQKGAKKLEKPLRVIIVTGGHDFERKEFFEMFDSFGDIKWEEHQQPKANEIWLGETLRNYDAVVLYDMWQQITEEQKQGMVRWLKDEGKGLVALHHSIASYQNWDEYAKIIGARYFIAPGKAPDGKTFDRSQFHHDIRFTVKVVDKNHPVTKGLPEQFEILDETYKGWWIAPGVHKLLATDHELSDPCVAWAKRYGKAKVVFIQLGHGSTAYNNPNFRTLVRNAILWVARGD